MKIERQHPSAAKAELDFAGFLARINPCPFKTAGLSSSWARANSCPFTNRLCNQFGDKEKPLPFKSQSKAPLNEAGLYDYAVKSLGRAMRTEAELRRLMRQRAEHGPVGETVVDAVIARLKEQRYLDDQAFAETYARLRQENEKLGQRTVRQKLAQKGVARAIVDETLEARYANTDEEALARAYLERKRIRKPEDERDTARVMRRLVAAGFSTRVIYKILRQWDVPDESLAALDSLGADPDEHSGE